MAGPQMEAIHTPVQGDACYGDAGEWQILCRSSSNALDSTIYFAKSRRLRFKSCLHLKFWVCN